MKGFLPLFFALAVTLSAQEFAPELAPIAKKYAADSAALAEQKSAAIAPARQQYLTALDATEKAVAAATTTVVADVLAKEREAVINGTLAPAVPAGFPKNLEPTRKSYTDLVTRVTSDYGLRQQRLNTDYLSRLNFLPTKGDPALTAQIAAEKQRLQANQPAVEGPMAHAKNLIVNGNFSQKDEGGQPVGWKTRTQTSLLQMEGNNPFIRLTNEIISQTVPAPPNAKEIKMTSRFRTNDGAECGFHIMARKADGSEELVFGTDWTKVEKQWKTFMEKGPIPKGAVSFEIKVEARKGTGDADDIVLETK